MNLPQSGVLVGKLTVNSARRILMQGFKRAGYDAAGLEAKLLVAHAANMSAADMIAGGNDVLNSEILTRLNKLAQRRLSGEPMSQILGYRDFWKDRFKVTPDVLTPRPETEGIIESALEVFNARPPETVLDLGTGSGAIILSLLGEFTKARAVAVDISPEALTLARGNAKALSRICEFKRSHWFADVKGTFDLIVSNPPYISTLEMQGLSKTVSEFEPELALHGGEDGLEPYREIARALPRHLNVKGVAIFEIGSAQGRQVCEIFEALNIGPVNLAKDLAGHDRIVRLIRS